MMRKSLRRIRQDIKNRRHVEVYVVSAAAVTFAVLSVVGDIVPDDIRWAVLFAGMGLLVYRIAVPDHGVTSLDTVLCDRSAFDEEPLSMRLRTARELWIFAPSGVNILAPPHCDAFRRDVLARPDGVVRVVVLDGAQEDAIDLAVQQLDDSVDYPTQRFRPSLSAVLDQLKTMAGWRVAGSFDYRLLGYNPGFSLVAIDPGELHGTVLVEIHGFHNESVSSRMHLELTRSDTERWYAYWVSQFDHIWSAARSPIGTQEPDSPSGGSASKR